MLLTTLEKVTTRLSKGYEAHLPLLNQLIEEVSLFVEGYLDRQCQTATKTETFDVEESQRIIRLTAWPITSTRGTTRLPATASSSRIRLARPPCSDSSRTR